MKSTDLIVNICDVLNSDKYPNEMTASQISSALVEMGIDTCPRTVNDSIRRDPLKRVCKWSFLRPKKYFINPFPLQRKSNLKK